MWSGWPRSSATAAGLALVGAVYGLIWYALPDRGVARQWYLYGPLLFGPYALAALGAGLAGRTPVARWVARILAAVMCLAGAAILGAALLDVRPVFEGDRPPDVPISGFVAAFLLVGQYMAGAGAVAAGAAGRLSPRAAQPGGAPDTGRGNGQAGWRVAGRPVPVSVLFGRGGLG